MRTDSRIVAFKTIFASTFVKTEKEKLLSDILEEVELNAKDLQFANELIEAYEQNKEEITKQIETAVDKYELNRIYKVDLALIALAITEINFIKTPKPVVVNEILEISKKFSTDKSSSFINGILAKI